MRDGPVAEPSAKLEPIVVAGRNCWRIELARRATVIVDAARYYHAIRKVFEASRRRIMIMGWDFDTRIPLEPDSRSIPGRDPERLGAMFLRLAGENPFRQIVILKWSFGAKKQFLNLRSAFMLLRWQITRAIDFRFDAAHPIGCSHHQKIVVVDDALAVCGGIDITAGRWDTPEHRDDDPRRLLPSGKAYGPWHDITVMAAGPLAGALAELGANRWKVATRHRLEPVEGDGLALWPDDLPADFTDVQIAIARTRAAYGELDELREVEALCLDMIAAARRHIYIENQYFTSGKIAAAIAGRLEQSDPPEIVFVMPRQADGWLEQRAMDGARVRLAREIAKRDPHNRFRIYVPVSEDGTDIYVHAKVAIIDGRLLRVGSSNLNNRSLALDSECDLVIDAALPGNEATPAVIARIRDTLLAEHLGVSAERFSEEYGRRGSLVDAIEALRGSGKTLELLDLIKPGPLDKFIADNELLDPQEADGFFEPLSQRGLWSSWRRGRAWFGRRKHSGSRRL